MVRRRLRSPPFPSYLYFFDRGLAAVSPSLSDPVDSAGGDPVPDSPGEGGGVGLYRLPSPGGRAGSSWSTNRARTRGLSIVLGSPLPSAGSSSSSGRRGPPCRRSRWSGCRRDGSTSGELVRPDSTRRGRVSSTLTSHPLRQLTPDRTRSPPVLAFRFADRPAVASRYLPSFGPPSRVAQPPTGRLRVPQNSCGSERWRPRWRRQ